MVRMFCLILCCCFFLFAVGCSVPGPNPYLGVEDNSGMVAGFWEGVWHSVIIPFTFIGSWFSEDVGIYEVHNNGFWYNFGLFFPGMFIGVIMSIIFNPFTIMEQIRRNQGYH